HSSPEQLPQMRLHGGAGFIGSALCRYLVGRCGYSVLNVDKLTYAASLQSLVAVADHSNCRRKRRQKCVCSDHEQPRAGTVTSANDLVYAVRSHTGSALLVIAPQHTAATTTSPIMRNLSHSPSRLGSKAQFDFPSCSTIAISILKFL